MLPCMGLRIKLFEVASGKAIASGGYFAEGPSNTDLIFPAKSLIKGAEDELLPPVRVVFYKEDDGTVPMCDWLDGLQPKHRAKCVKWIGILRSFGHELRRPESDYLRDGIYELRVRFQSLNYRMLYFFHRNEVIVLTHGLKKEKEVPAREIDKGIELKKIFEADPMAHTFEWEP